jgi:hypothetical protein
MRRWRLDRLRGNANRDKRSLMSPAHTMTMSSGRRLCAHVLCALGMLGASAAMSAPAQAQVQAGPVMADWTSVAGNAAEGTLLGDRVTLSGPDVAGYPSSRLDRSWPSFKGPTFSPALAQSDVIEIGGSASSGVYTLHFDESTTDPIMHLGSLGSTITFTNLPAGGRVVMVSGQTTFEVVGTSSVRGKATNDLGPVGLKDSSGTIKLIGTYKGDYTFTAAYGGTRDGIYLQLVAMATCTDWTAASPAEARGKLLGSDVRLRGTRISPTWSHNLNGEWRMFANPVFSPILATSDVIEIAAGPTTDHYTLHFDVLPKNPVIVLGSLASKITFPGAGVVIVSGENEFTRDGASSVRGVGRNVDPSSGLSDANGSIKLKGLTSGDVMLDAFYGGTNDGIYVQVCAAA